MPVIFSDPRVRLSRREGGRSHSLEAGVLGLKATERHCLRFEIRLGRWQCAERRLNQARLGRHHSLCHGSSAFFRQLEGALRKDQMRKGTRCPSPGARRSIRRETGRSQPGGGCSRSR